VGEGWECGCLCEFYFSVGGSFLCEFLVFVVISWIWLLTRCVGFIALLRTGLCKPFHFWKVRNAFDRARRGFQTHEGDELPF
jgi:hypothetical protein